MKEKLFRKGFVMKKVVTIVLAVVLVCALLAGCGVSKGFAANLEYAKGKISDFVHDQKRNESMFATDIFKTANIAAMMITKDSTDEDYENIAKNLSLVSLTVADENHNIVGSYPAGDKDKKLKELDDKKNFASVIRNATVKQMTDPVYNEDDGTYSLLAGVKRTDGTGVVIIECKTTAYADVNGDNLAEKCGNNMIVVKNDAVISSTVDGVAKADSLDAIKLTADDLKKDTISFTADGKNYTAKAATEAGITVICAEPK